MERLLNIKDAAHFLNVSEMTIRRWTNSGKLKCYRLGGKRERRFQESDLTGLLHGSKNHRLKPLGIRDQKAPDGAHITHFYSGKQEAFAAAVPYLLEGAKHGENLLVVMPPERSRELLENLGQQTDSVANWHKTGRLKVSTGVDSPEEMIRYLCDFAIRSKKFRVLGDMVWTVSKGWDLATLSVLERASNLMPPEGNGLLLCQYSLEEFSGQHIMMATELHTHTIYKGKIEKSPYFENVG